MTHRLFGLGSVIIVCLFLPGTGLAESEPPLAPLVPLPSTDEPPKPLPGTLVPQPATAPPVTAQPAPSTSPPTQSCSPGSQPSVAGPSTIPYGPGHWHYSGYPYGPRIAPTWHYPMLEGGPEVIYPWGLPGYVGRAAHYGPHGLSIYGPPVPVYGPVPATFNPRDVVYPGRNVSGPGFIYGWIGPFPASPRPRRMTVSTWSSGIPTGQSTSVTQPAGVIQPGGGCLSLSVRVPQPTAEVFVNGVKTTQTGVDRLYDSPPLEAGHEFQYEVSVRWMEQGVAREKKQSVRGGSGDTLRIDFTTSDVTVVGK